MNHFQYITSTPGILNGKPRIANTRISVELILTWLGNNSSIAQIIDEYPKLSEAMVREAIQYAAMLSKNELFIDLAVADEII